MDFSQWSELRRGAGCTFDSPRPEATEEQDLVCSLSVSTLYLLKNQTYRGHCVLILDLRHATRPDELSAEEWRCFCTDLHTAERAIARTVEPDHINVASLGNLMPHLHWHIIPRYRDDPRWGAPIWQGTNLPNTPLEMSQYRELLQRLRHTLA